MKLLLSGLVLVSSIGSMAKAEELSFAREFVPVGKAVFQLVQEDEVRGQMTYATRFEDGLYVIDETTVMRPDIQETGTIILDAESFLPRREIIDGDFSGSIIDADLSFSNGTVTGEYRLKRPGDLEKRVVPFEKEAPEGLLSRASLFGLTAALPLDEGHRFTFPWFSSLSGAIEEVTLEVTGRVSVAIPAGEAEAFRIEVQDVTPENVIYVSVDTREVLRIDVPSLDMRFERLPPDTE
ncbi:hypothetical protein [Parvularcula marina]|uniref:DUF3108 domain-containing protein n=1 Tax=Parvularcula marina TaxID=2292771 RepID=UPI003515E16E